jgi:hypothetical protein
MADEKVVVTTKPNTNAANTVNVPLCNVCGGDKRGYMLTEFPGGPGLMMGAGPCFVICTDCLRKLIDGIKTDKTVFDDPETIPQHPMARRFLARMNRARKSQ